ncbi:MAG TPA: PIN domain-containing protein [Polyangiaceae bacterium]|nr:PIN domain-containing protein [Polyangiaceae bacterium]
MSVVVFDAGALIAVERNDRELWATLKLLARNGDDVLVPSTVVAQVWRGTRSQARLGSALGFCVIVPFDPLARKVGELCGRTRTTDICDAHVALVAAHGADVLYTSDERDLRRLLAACGRSPTVVRC